MAPGVKKKITKKGGRPFIRAFCELPCHEELSLAEHCAFKQPIAFRTASERGSVQKKINKRKVTKACILVTLHRRYWSGLCCYNICSSKCQETASALSRNKKRNKLSAILKNLAAASDVKKTRNKHRARVFKWHSFE